MSPTAVSRWLMRCSAESKDGGSIPDAVAAFKMEVKALMCRDFGAR